MWRDGDVVSFRSRVVEPRRHRRQQRPRRGANRDRQRRASRRIREAVRALCARFPGEYWRALDRERAYPEEFVAALTEAGFLAALIPEEYGGSGLGLERCGGDHGGDPGLAAATAPPATRRCTPWARCCGTAAPSRSSAICRRSPRGELRLQAFGVTEPTSGTDTLALRTTAVRDGDHYVVNGQKIWTSRAEHSDLMLLLARTTPREQAKKRTDGLSVFLVDMRAAKGTGSPSGRSAP